MELFTVGRDAYKNKIREFSRSVPVLFPLVLRPTAQNPFNKNMLHISSRILHCFDHFGEQLQFHVWE